MSWYVAVGTATVLAFVAVVAYETFKFVKDRFFSA